MSVTGEDTLSGEASNIARMVTLDYPRLKDTDYDKWESIKNNKHLYSAFTARYIYYILNQNKDDISKTRLKYLKKYDKLAKNGSNTTRIVRNLALIMTNYFYLAHFMWTEKQANINIEKIDNYLSQQVGNIITQASDEKSATRFMSYLNEYMAIGKFRILPEANFSDFGQSSKAAIVGYQRDGKTYLMPVQAYNEIQKQLKAANDKLNHSLAAVLNDLYEDGKIVSNKTTSTRLNNKPVRVVEMTGDFPLTVVVHED
jgi:hypothetical protein